MRNAIANSFERNYQEHFGAWVDFRVRCGRPVLLEGCRGSTANVCVAFVRVRNALVTKISGSAIVESRLSAIVVCQRSSFSVVFREGSSWTLLILSLVNALKGPAR